MIKPITLRAELKYPQWVKGPKGDKGDPAYQLTIDEQGELVADNGEEDLENGED